MIRKPARGLFVTGVDTEVGKTYVTALIARCLRQQGRCVGVYKPAASGCERRGGDLVSEDALALWEAAGRVGELSAVCPQRFQAPLAPHLAARAEGRELDPLQLREGLGYWEGRCEVVLVEGAGGLMSPLTDEEYVADLAYDFDYPLIVVSANRLGCINQTLQTLIAADAFRDGLEVAGVVLNELAAGAEVDVSRATNGSELAARCGPPLLTRVGWQATQCSPAVDWWRLTAPP